MSREVQLTRGIVAIVDDADYNLVLQSKWFATTNGYAARTVRGLDGKNIRIHLHRFIMGVTDPKSHVDHINGNGFDNRRSNLRICSHAENRCNNKVYANNKSGFPGVAWSKCAGKWQAYITAGRKRKHLGLFESKERAYAAYCDAAKVLHKEFSRTGV
jgi:hypothetical protein